MTPLYFVSAFMTLSSNISLLRMLSVWSKLKDPPMGNLIHFKLGVVVGIIL